MVNLSRKWILYLVLALISVILMVSCSTDQLIDATAVPTKPPPATIYFPAATSQPKATTQPAPTAEPTSIPTLTEIPTQTDIPALIEDLMAFSIITTENVEKLVFLKEGNLNPSGGTLNFDAYDWSQDGALIVICAFTDDSSSYQVIDLISGSLLSEIQVDIKDCESPWYGGYFLEFSRDGNKFLGIVDSAISIGSEGDTSVAVFDSFSGDQISSLEGLSVRPEEHIYLYAATFSSQGTRLAVLIYELARPASTADAAVQGGAFIGPYSLIELYDVQSGNHWGSFRQEKDCGAVDLEYSTEGEYLVFGVGDFAQAWSVEGEMIYETRCVFPQINFSPTAEVAVLKCGYHDYYLDHLLWDLRTGDSQKLIEVPDEYHLLKFSPDGRLLLGLSESGEVSLWHGVSGEYLFTLPDTFLTAVDAHFIGDGRLIAVLLEDGGLKLFGIK